LQLPYRDTFNPCQFFQWQGLLKIRIHDCDGTTHWRIPYSEGPVLLFAMITTPVAIQPVSDPPPNRLSADS
jgi:hypothetical protein